VPSGGTPVLAAARTGHSGSAASRQKGQSAEGVLLASDASAPQLPQIAQIGLMIAKTFFLA
jgi:hypothetical protein